MKKIRWHIAQFFEKHWWKNYLNGKSPKAYLEWKRNYWLTFLSKIGLELNAIQDPVIDIGCGPAGMFMVLENREVTGLDPLLLAYENLAIFNQRKYPNVRFKGLSFEAFDAKEKFNTIFCLNAINHFIDIQESFSKLYEICASGGRVVVSVDAHNHSFFRRLFALLPLDVLHPHQYYLEEYQEMLTSQGFTVEKKVLIKKEWFFDYYVLLAIK